MQILNVNNNIVAYYAYDAWGNLVSVTDANGNEITSKTNFAVINPIRYRGYYYDSETGFYYLQSRYYDPANCRFISADDIVSTDHETTNLNLFAYCGNDPINRIDPNGKFFISTMIVCTVVGAVIDGTVGGILGNVYANDQGYTGWEKTKCILTGIDIGGLTGGTASYFAAPAIASATGVTGLSISSAGISTVGIVEGSLATEKTLPTINEALKQLNNSGLRPGQSQISASGVMNYVNNPKLLQEAGKVFRNGSQRFLVDGHHRMVAQTILGNGNFYTMPTNTLPSATNIYWSKHWCEFGKTAIKVIK